jgi:hypothetical protein
MKTGMLWFDNDPKANLSDKVSRAAAYYTKKYGQVPNICFVHPSMVAEPVKGKSLLEVRPNGLILPNHFWIGVYDASGRS